MMATALRSAAARALLQRRPTILLRPISSASAGTAATHPPGGPDVQQEAAAHQHCPDNKTQHVVSQQTNQPPCRCSCNCRSGNNPDADRNKKAGHVSSQIKQIEEMKHELFYLLADLDKNSRVLRSSNARGDNRDLIYELLKHVTPNPDDELWRYFRGHKRVSNFAYYVAWTITGVWAVSTLLTR